MEQHDLTWADALAGPGPFLGEIFALAFVRGVEPLEALRRAGGLMDTLAPRTPQQIWDLHCFDHGYPEVVSALALGEWTVLVQPTGYEIESLADALSRGTEAVGILRHDYASPCFSHAVNGKFTARFNPRWPDPRPGDCLEPLLPLMREAGFDTDPVDYDSEDYETEDWNARYAEPIARSLRLAGLITGVLPSLDQLTAPLPGTHFESRFSHTRPPVVDNAVHKAAELVSELALEDTPGLAEALAAARRGDPVVVTPDSDLGRHVREWSLLARRASWTLNHERSRMTDEERARGTQFANLLYAMTAAFRADLA
ncbi:DUF6461 domain-containing protein [Lentzea sp. NEAU-D7]|uniref:DUF6461 domain-containing protein n=1 Tax=Lentzea sp. NEAU-D7 TaxID=2994667 RepID=UPI00224AB09F|nr:DUF6461 domain-containing protein [Lentzea sp. NEAU-D7]MCX2952764.1 DUF6461 domain-containing protein [Lentzea sp. NEAU-D7]